MEILSLSLSSKLFMIAEDWYVALDISPENMPSSIIADLEEECFLMSRLTKVGDN